MPFCLRQFVVLALAVVAASQESQYVPGSDRDAEIIRNDFSLDEAGGFVADMETSNSIVQGATGTSIPGAEPETGSYTMSGGWRETRRRSGDGFQLCVTAMFMMWGALLHTFRS